ACEHDLRTRRTRSGRAGRATFPGLRRSGPAPKGLSIMDHLRHWQPGDPAPAFSLPAVNREGPVSLDDYRGKRAVLVALFRGLHCPFCRRQIARLSATRQALAEVGVETVAVVNTPLERARQYFQYRPTPLVLAADPDVRTHQAFGLG